MSSVFDPWVWRFDPSDGRELATYSRGEHVEECSWQIGPELRHCVDARENAREFILKNWRSKKRAYVAVDFPCIDCAPVRHLFIEPDTTGRWRIATVLEDRRFAPRYPPNAFGVKYRRANRREVDRERVRRVLSFLDESGKELASF